MTPAYFILAALFLLLGLSSLRRDIRMQHEEAWKDRVKAGDVLVEALQRQVKAAEGLIETQDGLIKALKSKTP